MSKLLKLVTYLFNNRWMLRSFPSTIYFNFHYLPFSQAIYLPIWLYKPNLVKCSGSIVLERSGGGVRPGMIQLGRIGASIYPNSGIMWENRGVVVFEGSAFIGNNSYVSIGPNAKVFFGDGFVARASFKLVSYHCVKFLPVCTIGWDCMIMDTDFHAIKLHSGGKSKGYGSVIVGSHTWIANNSIILKNAVIPDYSVIAARSLICESCEKYPNYSIIGNSCDTILLSSGWMDRNDNKIEYIDLDSK